MFHLLIPDLLSAVARFLPAVDQVIMLRCWPCLRSKYRAIFIEHELTRTVALCNERQQMPWKGDGRGHHNLLMQFHRRAAVVADRAELLIWLQFELEFLARGWKGDDVNVPNDLLSWWCMAVPNRMECEFDQDLLASKSRRWGRTIPAEVWIQIFTSHGTSWDAWEARRQYRQKLTDNIFGIVRPPPLNPLLPIDERTVFQLDAASAPAPAPAPQSILGSYLSSLSSFSTIPRASARHRAKRARLQKNSKKRK